MKFSLGVLVVALLFAPSVVAQTKIVSIKTVSPGTYVVSSEAGAQLVNVTPLANGSYSFVSSVGSATLRMIAPGTYTLTTPTAPIDINSLGNGVYSFSNPATGSTGQIEISGVDAARGTYSIAVSTSSPGAEPLNSVNFALTALTALTVLTSPNAIPTYYLAPASDGGSDSNDGLSPNTPWLTPRHAVNCGDVILAAPSSSYSGADFNAGEWGAVACPGGNNVAWLKCATFDACKIASTPVAAIWIDKPYWGVQGWEVDGSNNIVCYGAGASPINPVTVHHVIFANDIATNCGASGFGASNLYQSKTASADYLSIVGTISYDTASAPGICGQAIAIYQPILSDSNPGTHFFIAGNFAWDSMDARTCNGGVPSDGNGIILDTFDGVGNGLTPYAGQSLVENNIVLFNGGRGIQMNHNSAGNTYFKQNTVYGNNKDPTQGACGEIAVNLDSGNTYISGNIAATSAPTTCIGATWWDYIVGASPPAVQITSGIAYSPAGYNCEAIWAATFSCGEAAITPLNPNFNNPINPGAPSCGGFSSVPACMAAVIADYTPTNSSAAGYGYQIPSPTSIVDPLFPKWLCNVNLPPGLLTMGCN